MKIGFQVASFTWPGGAARIGGTLADIARAADAAGFHSLWVMDHYFQIGMIGPPEQEMLEAYTTLGYLAGVTKRIKLGTLVTGVSYRYPGILAKTVTSLDVVSGGRAYLGIGAAWFEEEARALGVPFPPLGERFERLEETLQIVKQMWSGKDDPYHGKHYQLGRTLCSPPPVHRPHPPILIGGNGEKKTLRLVAQYADACNVFGDSEGLRAKLDVLKRHCDDVGRDYGTIEKTTIATANLAGGDKPADIVAHLKGLAGLGIQHAILGIPAVEEIKPLEIIGREIIPAVAGF